MTEHERTKLAEKSDADLDRVTDYVEERELDSDKVAQSMTAVLGQQESTQKARRDRELSAVKLRAEDVEVVMNEMELDKREAERALREHRGDVVATLRALVQ